jgi:transcriptional regulator with XRE-family HTH domain
MTLKSASERLKENATAQELIDLSYMDILASIASAFIKYRSEYHLTQKELADKLGTSQVMVSRIENGEWNLSMKKLVEYAKKLGGEVDVQVKLPGIDTRKSLKRSPAKKHVV